MVQFIKIRLSGFKSFVEPTELLVEKGLTGIVGPNGCGKSNLVEALRWVMGETAPKKLRGGEMDDVIFGGTAERPARNLAEVVLALDNSDRRAPAAFNDNDEIEVVRRIERGMGSAYRINGREVRARDVQLVFADAASGARSTALVGQGRVGAIINAKPADRRGLLEEAAGITGLHSRRHEAELRLRAAENNLERLDDVVTAFQGQLQGLKRQARQASRYRNLSGHIRKAEAILLHLRWREAEAARDAAEARLREIAAQVAEQTRQVSAATAQHADAASGLPALRAAEAEAAAELHRLSVAREQLEAEEQRIAESRRRAEEALAQIDGDMERERTLASDAEAMLARLEAERAELDAAAANEAETREALAEAVREAEQQVAMREAAFTSLAERIAAAEARRSDIARRIAETSERVARLERRRSEIAQERDALSASAPPAAARAELEAAVSAAQARLAAVRLDAENVETARAAAQAADDEQRKTLREAEAELSKLAAEAQAIEELLAGGGDSGHAPVVDALTVSTGYEAALDAALGDDLAASIEESAPLSWRALPPLASPPPLPAGAQPLADVVSAPPALGRRLSQVGLVPDAETGRRLQEALAQGQRLVTRDGGLWRWDGFTVAAGAATAAGQRLAQRSRLEALRTRVAAAERRAEEARRGADAAAAKADAAAERARQARVEADQCFAALSTARDKLAEATEASAQANSRLAVLAQAAEATAADLAEAEAALAALRETEAGLTDPEADRTELARLREALGEARAMLAAHHQEADARARESDARARRRSALDGETESWRRRAAGATAKLEELEARRASVEGERERLARLPEEIAARRQSLLSALTEAEERRRAAADRLAAAEEQAAALEKALRAAEAQLADLREARGLAEGAVKQAEQAVAGVAQRIAERLDCRPEQALAAAELKEGEALPEVEAVEERLARLIKERDNMGPVNLRAEEEAEELGAQIESLEAERADLLGAIGKFRRAISELNQEGRERLLASFAEVDRHFRDLFTRLFGGGRAHLSLVDSEDPLEAGLEIMASPPGKRLQVLSLLSGGEQALTALALLFAVFLTNPAPVCVLDEVDAPLDDANVDRFCTLIEELAHSSDTRFLLITHHRMTMARMDRLYGVTMPERGVSQLVSVDLQSAEAMRESA